MNDLTIFKQIDNLHEQVQKMNDERNKLIDWLHSQIEMEMSCIDDLEMTEGVENQWGRGRVSAWEQLLKEIHEANI